VQPGQNLTGGSDGRRWHERALTERRHASNGLRGRSPIAAAAPGT
jgi:hypothetical protein